LWPTLDWRACLPQMSTRTARLVREGLRQHFSQGNSRAYNTAIRPIAIHIRIRHGMKFLDPLTHRLTFTRLGMFNMRGLQQVTELGAVREQRRITAVQAVQHEGVEVNVTLYMHLTLFGWGTMSRVESCRSQLMMRPSLGQTEPLIVRLH
jgi:hypothetical protein